MNSSLSAPGIDPDEIDKCIDRISGMDKELARTVIFDTTHLRTKFDLRLVPPLRFSLAHMKVTGHGRSACSLHAASARASCCSNELHVTTIKFDLGHSSKNSRQHDSLTASHVV